VIIYADALKCTGCRACEVFCSLEQEGLANPARSGIRVVKDEPRNLFLPLVCPPCDEKACIAACAEPGALRVMPETGAVAIVEALCTGCSKCVSACDIGAIKFLRQTGRGKFGKAVVVKCNQCRGAPWCVKMCEPGALQYIAEAPDLNGQTVFERLRAALKESEKILAERGGQPRRRVKIK